MVCFGAIFGLLTISIFLVYQAIFTIYGPLKSLQKSHKKMKKLLSKIMCKQNDGAATIVWPMLWVGRKFSTKPGPSFWNQCSLTKHNTKKMQSQLLSGVCIGISKTENIGDQRKNNLAGQKHVKLYFLNIASEILNNNHHSWTITINSIPFCFFLDCYLAGQDQLLGC